MSEMAVNQEDILLTQSMIFEDIKARELPYYKAIREYRDSLCRVREASMREMKARTGLYNTTNTHIECEEESNRLNRINSPDYEKSLIRTAKALENKIQAQKTYEACYNQTNLAGRNSKEAHEVLCDEANILSSNGIEVDIKRDLNLMKDDPYYKAIETLSITLDSLKGAMHRESLSKQKLSTTISDYSYYSMMAQCIQNSNEYDIAHKRVMKAFENKTEAEKTYNCCALETKKLRNYAKRAHEDAINEGLPIAKRICR